MAPSDSFKYDVFISYSHHDAQWVQGWLLPHLETAGITVCIDFRGFEPGAYNMTEMERAVLQSRKTLLVLTPEYIASGYATFENILASSLDPAAQDRRVLPLRLKHCEPPLRISALAYLDFTRSQTEISELERLIDALRTDRATGDVNPAKLAHKEEPIASNAEENNAGQSLRENLPTKLFRELIGRQVQIDQAMTVLRDPSGYWIIAIDGMGGIGKTALVRELADCALHEGLFDVIVWESAKEAEFSGEEIRHIPVATFTFEKVLDAIARQLGVLDTGRKKEERVKGLLKSQRVLVVLDNVDTAKENQDEIARKLHSFLNPAKLVLTSRHKFKGEVFPITLSGLQQADAITFVRKEAQMKQVHRVAQADTDHLIEIATTTGGVPLAMKLVVGQLAYLDIGQVLTYLRQAKFEDIGYEFYKFIFRPSWQLLSKDAKDILISMSCLPSIGGDREALLAGSAVPENQFDPSMNELWTTSLVEIGGNFEKVRYSLHPLTQNFVRSDIVKWWR